MLKKYMRERKESIKSLKIVPREIKFNASKEFIVSIIGPRRAGKSYAVFDFIKKNVLEGEKFLFINFEEEEIASAKREHVLNCITEHIELYGTEPEYLLFDEIQAFTNWQRWLYTLYERKKYKIFVTGSSSKLLSKEIATQLRGRSTTKAVFPFSFREYSVLHGLKKHKVYTSKEEGLAKKLLREYLKQGGFPQIVLNQIKPFEFFRDYIDLVIFRDIVERYDVKEPRIALLLMKFASESFGKEFSINRVFNILHSNGMRVSKKTLYSYATYLEDAMFAFYLKKFSFSMRTSELSIPKVYINDPGVINYMNSSSPSENIGRLMENTVFIELKKAEFSGDISKLYYWKDANYEVDFVIMRGNKVQKLIQISYAENEDEIRKREIRALEKASKILKCKNAYIITWSAEAEKKYNGLEIKMIPLWKWLIERPI